ncbi:hypothetical protein HKX48_005866 [Thoreauomyces humboldtii]|nr:hypothetical protein HKX48_005866 [Thoreauomyces humboldtii]
MGDALSVLLSQGRRPAAVPSMPAVSEIEERPAVLRAVPEFPPLLPTLSDSDEATLPTPPKPTSKVRQREPAAKDHEPPPKKTRRGRPPRTDYEDAFISESSEDEAAKLRPKPKPRMPRKPLIQQMGLEPRANSGTSDEFAAFFDLGGSYASSRSKQSVSASQASQETVAPATPEEETVVKSEDAEVLVKRKGSQISVKREGSQGSGPSRGGSQGPIRPRTATPTRSPMVSAPASSSSSDTEDEGLVKREVRATPYVRKRVAPAPIRDVSLTPPPTHVDESAQLYIATIRESMENVAAAFQPRVLPVDVRVPDSAFDPALQPSGQGQTDYAPILEDVFVNVMVSRERFPSQPGNPFDLPPIAVSILSSKTFEALMNHSCIRWSIAPKDAIFVFNNIPLFPRGTPNAVRMVGNGHIQLFTRTEHALAESAERAAAASARSSSSYSSLSSQPIPLIAPPGAPSLSGAAPQRPVEFNATADGSRLLIKMAHKTDPPVKVNVRATTTVAELIAIYAKERGDPPAGQSYRIVVEGDTMAGGDTLEDADVESGDLLEVHIR